MRHRKDPVVTAGVVLGLFLLSAGLVACADKKLPKGILVLDGQPAHALKLKSMDGKEVDLEKLKGQWVFVHFWASWCGPCKKEMPTIQAISTKKSLAKLKILLVNTAESEDTVFSFLSIAAPDLDVFLDTDGAVTEKWQPHGLPATFLVDPEGRMQYMALGGRPWTNREYGRFLESLIAGK